jgi:hypothetical protein
MPLTPAECQDHLQAVLDSLTVLAEDLEHLGQPGPADAVWQAAELACQSAATLAAAVWSVQL